MTTYMFYPLQKNMPKKREREVKTYKNQLLPPLFFSVCLINHSKAEFKWLAGVAFLCGQIVSTPHPARLPPAGVRKLGEYFSHEYIRQLEKCNEKISGNRPVRTERYSPKG